MAEKQEAPSAETSAPYDLPLVTVVSGTAAALGAMAVSWSGLPAVAASLTGALALANGALMLHRHRSLALARRLGVERSAGPGRPVLGVTAAFLVTPLLAVAFGGDHHPDWPVRGLAITATVTAGVIHLSSLIDWAVIGLRLKGVVGDWTLPCQDSKRWNAYTRLWLAHRLTAYLVVRIGIAALIGFAGALIVGSDALASDPPNIDNKTLATVVVSFTATILIFFLNRFLPVWSLVLNPRLRVGDQIVLAEEYGVGVTKRPVYYVVDVAIEGIKLLELHGGTPTPRGAGPDREHDRSLPLADVPRLLRFRGRFKGCQAACSMANHHCPVGYAVEVRTHMDKKALQALVSEWFAEKADGDSELGWLADAEVVAHPAYLTKVGSMEGDDYRAGAVVITPSAENAPDAHGIRKLGEAVARDRTLGGRTKQANFEPPRRKDAGTIVVVPA